MAKKMTYKSSGVDIDKANAFVKAIGGSLSQTRISGVMKNKGAFGALFALDIRKMKHPVLVSSSDGVGTKLLVAKTCGRHNTVGIDLVAMNVNDILCAGARPLFFMDYIACGKLNPGLLKRVVSGIAVGCRQAGCALIGGETAEMPGMYAVNDYDLAGFTVGILDRDSIVDGSKIRVGDRLIGLASNGIHSNGYSLVRKVFTPAEQKNLARELLKPTRIYVREVLELLQQFNVHGMAHITGGAFFDKLTKVLPRGLCFAIDSQAWSVPKIFQKIQKKGKIARDEMFRTFNMGIGFVVVVAPGQGRKVVDFFKAKGITAFDIGQVGRNRREKIILK